MFKEIVFLLLNIHIVPSTKIIIKKIIFIIIKTGNYNYKNYFFNYYFLLKEQYVWLITKKLCL